jgi:hypothetical protein
MGNVVMKGDGYTPDVAISLKLSDNIPLDYINIAHVYVDKLSIHVRGSKWTDIQIIKTNRGTFQLQCGFKTLLPHFPVPFEGIIPVFGGPKVDFTAQLNEIRTWIPINDTIRMEIGPDLDYLIWIELVIPPFDIREEQLKMKDAEIARLKEMLYWSPNGQGAICAGENFKLLSKQQSE